MQDVTVARAQTIWLKGQGEGVKGKCVLSALTRFPLNQEAVDACATS